MIIDDAFHRHGWIHCILLEVFTDEKNKHTPIQQSTRRWSFPANDNQHVLQKTKFFLLILFQQKSIDLSTGKIIE